MTPTISALMPVRDGARYLGASIDSVLAEPEITELIVVDDGSTDETPEVLAGYGDRIRVIRQAPTGQPPSLNRLVREATGDLIAIQDADDLWVPGRTSALLAAFDDDVEGVFGWIEQFVSPDLTPEEQAQVRVDERPQVSYLLQTLLLRREAFWRIGPLDESLTSGANIDWISRARSGGLRHAVVPAVVLRRRIHLTNMSRTLGDEKVDNLLRIVRAHLDRKRSEPQP